MPTPAELFAAAAGGHPEALGASSLWRADDRTVDRDVRWHADPGCADLPRRHREVTVAFAGRGRTRPDGVAVRR